MCGLIRRFRRVLVLLVLAAAVFLIVSNVRRAGKVPGNECRGVSKPTEGAPSVHPAPSPSAPRRLSPAVRGFASLSGAVTAEARRARLAEFPDLLSAAEVSALTNFLSAPESRISGAAPRDALFLKNDAANALLARAPADAGLASFFAAQFLDGRNSRGWRDYALQSLPGALLRDRSPASLRLAGDVAAFSDPRLRRFRGTALNGLAELERAGVRFTGISSGAAASAVLRDRDSDECSLLAALAFLRERERTSDLPELRRLAASSPSLLVRRLASEVLAGNPD